MKAVKLSHAIPFDTRPFEMRPRCRRQDDCQDPHYTTFRYGVVKLQGLTTNMEKLGDQGKESLTIVPWLTLDDVGLLPNIFTYLPADDLNAVAMCSRRFHLLRSEPTLDQTRSLELRFNGSEDAMRRFLFFWLNCSYHFSTNQRKLKLRGFVERLTEETLATCSPISWTRPSNFTILDLRSEKRPINPQVIAILRQYLKIVGKILPNVTTLDISNSEEIVALLSHIKSGFPSLECLIANHSGVVVLMEGWTLRQWTSLIDLYVQGQQGFIARDLKNGLPPNLERLDLWMARDMHGLAVGKEDLRDILVNLPRLIWLRCELSDSDRLFLLGVRPGMTVVNF